MGRQWHAEGTNGGDQFVGDPNANQPLVGVVAKRQVWIDHGGGDGELGWGMVMVGDDDVEAQRPGVGDLFAVADATVDRKQELYAASPEPSLVRWGM
jgi:hypothetical protein